MPVIGLSDTLRAVPYHPIPFPATPTDDAALVAAAQADPAAFAALYNRYYPQIYRFAQRRTGDPTLAEDVAAETFLAAFKSLPRYEWRGIAFSAWLYRIAATVIAGQHRRNGTLAQVPLENTLYPLAEPASDEPGPDAQLEQREEQEWERRRLRAATLLRMSRAGRPPIM
jgi:RNA polymerase sigma-70 factor (ECF subfamily)